jgi:hypothetical protein
MLVVATCYLFLYESAADEAIRQERMLGCELNSVTVEQVYYVYNRL